LKEGEMSQSLPAKGKEPKEKVSDERKWYQKKRWTIPIGIVLASSILNAISGGEDSPTQPVPESVKVATDSGVVPDLTGAIARDAETTLEELGFMKIIHQDASYKDRMVLDRDNWFICVSRPESGASASLGQTIVLMSVKNNEVCPSVGSTEAESTEYDSSESDSDEAKSDTTGSGAFGKQTTEQVKMIAVIESYKKIYDEAATDLRKGNARIERDEAICSIIGNGKVSNWSGVVEDIGATSEALGYIKVAIGDNITLETWNNEFSDVFDDTLIPRKSPMYKILLDLREGQIVTFSGSFIRGDGVCLDTKNLTRYFAVNRPEFVFKFTSLEPK
jgi:hypothetical protein